MNAKEFFQRVSGDDRDIIQLLLDAFRKTETDYCVIGGLAVNAYVEPVVSLDLDVVVVAGNIDTICRRVEREGLRVEEFPHSRNIGDRNSDLRIQLQTDGRYQDFLPRATVKKVLGYEMRVAALHDVMQGKLWAYQDETRRRSKRQKDLADIFRLVEAYPELKDNLPTEISNLAS